VGWRRVFSVGRSRRIACRVSVQRYVCIALISEENGILVLDRYFDAPMRYLFKPLWGRDYPYTAMLS
jgi:hypothetical protein